MPNEFRFPINNWERNNIVRSLNRYDETLDFVTADVSLGLACQEFCRTRDDLTDFALRQGLAPYLKPFLQRRGWIDDDWSKRLDELSTSFRHQVN